MEMLEDINEYKELYNELETYEEKGVDFELNGIKASPMQIVTAHMVKESGSYMRGYDCDCQGCIRKLTFIDVGIVEDEPVYKYM